MVIGIDASRANKKQRTGTEWYSYFLIEELKKLSFKTQPHRFLLYSAVPLENSLETMPPHFTALVLRWPLKLFWTQIRLAWEMVVRPPDVLFVPAHTLPIFSRAKMVVTIHDVGFRALPHLYSKIDIWYHRFSTWFASRFAEKIICPSQFTKNELVKYYPASAKKIRIVPHGVHIPEKQSNTIAVNHPFFLYIGRLEEKKNILNIVKAFEQFQKKYPRFRLQLAGRPGYGFEKVARYIKTRQLSDKIWISGYIPESRKQQLYASATALVFPTLYEGFGLPILEAQSMDCPVITSDSGANAEVAGNSALLVNPNNFHTIVQAMERLVTQNKLRQDLIQKGRINITRFTWSACAKQTLQVLNEVQATQHR